jgi:hypothetical protein
MHEHSILKLDLSQAETCYLLGFFWADCFFGFSKQKNCYEFSFEIKSEDFEKIWLLLQGIGFQKFYTRKRKNSFKSQSNIRLAKKADMIFFEKFGFHQKNLGCPLYFCLSQEMKPFFIKGFLDGDGSISLDKNGLFRVGFNGSKNQSWDFMEDFLKIHEIEFYLYRKDRTSKHESHKQKIHGYSVLEPASIQSKIKLCHILETANIGLTRKIDIYKDYKAFRQEKQKTSKFMKKLNFDF